MAGGQDADGFVQSAGLGGATGFFERLLLRLQGLLFLGEFEGDGPLFERREVLATQFEVPCRALEPLLAALQDDLLGAVGEVVRPVHLLELLEFFPSFLQPILRAAERMAGPLDAVEHRAGLEGVHSPPLDGQFLLGLFNRDGLFDRCVGLGHLRPMHLLRRHVEAALELGERPFVFRPLLGFLVIGGLLAVGVGLGRLVLLFLRDGAPVSHALAPCQREHGDCPGYECPVQQ